MKLPDFVIDALNRQIIELKICVAESSGEPGARYQRELDQLVAYVAALESD